MATNRYFKSKHNLAVCNKYTSDEKPVSNGLSITPRDIKSLSERGIAVSTQNLGIVSDPDCPSNILPFEHRRGADINSVWEHSYMAKDRIIRNYRQSKKLSND